MVEQALQLSCVTCAVTVSLTPCDSLSSSARSFFVRHESCLTSVDLRAYRRLLTASGD